MKFPLICITGERRGHDSLPGAALRPHSVVETEALALRREECVLILLGQSRSNARAGLQSRRPRPRDLSVVNMLDQEAIVDLWCRYPLVRKEMWLYRKAKERPGRTQLFTDQEHFPRRGQSRKLVFDCPGNRKHGSSRCNKYSLLFAFTTCDRSVRPSLPQTTIRGNGLADLDHVLAVIDCCSALA